MESFVRRYFFAFTLAAIALGAVLAAKTVNHLVEAEVFLEDEDAIRLPKSKPLERPSAASTPRSTDITAILQRNVFCSACPPILAQPLDEDEESSSEPVPTTLPVQLVATMVSPDPGWSFAAIRDTGVSRTFLFRVASQLHGTPGVVLTSIEPQRVFLDNNGRAEYLDLENGAEKPRGRRASPKPSAKKALAEEIDKGVRKVSENAYEVDRALVRKIMSAPRSIARSARILPSVKNGQPNGFRLVRVRRNSPYRKIGLRSGDTIHAINGQEITTPDKALEVYTKVRNASHITVSLTRRGKPKTLDYTIR